MLDPTSLPLPFFLGATTFGNWMCILAIHSSQFYIKMSIHNQCLILVLVSSDLIQIYTDIFFFTLYTFSDVSLLNIFNLYLTTRKYSTVWLSFYSTISQETDICFQYFANIIYDPMNIEVHESLGTYYVSWVYVYILKSEYSGINFRNSFLLQGFKNILL